MHLKKGLGMMVIAALLAMPPTTASATSTIAMDHHRLAEVNLRQADVDIGPINTLAFDAKYKMMQMHSGCSKWPTSNIAHAVLPRAEPPIAISMMRSRKIELSPNKKNIGGGDYAYIDIGDTLISNSETIASHGNSKFRRR